MSAISTPDDSPASSHIQPLHNPGNAAHVVVPQAPLGNATNGPIKSAPGMGAKALFEKRLAKSNATYVSPTDSMMTPTTQKINAAKRKHFNKGAKLIPSLFQQESIDEQSNDKDDEDVNETETNEEQPFPSGSVPEAVNVDAAPIDVDDNPF